ncbi:MAG: hypothetical protein EON85_08935 [Brevundimonas sp.]|nr:MAG: hypothetical protein EON85_08935 [Brevundimonas sp.]
MLSPLKPLLCRHDYVRADGVDRCRRCGKPDEAARPVVETPVQTPFADPAHILKPRPPAPVMGPPVDDGFLDLPAFNDPLKPRRAAAGDRVLKAQARSRRDALMDLLDRLAYSPSPSREEALDAVLAVIEDAHSAEPLLFGEHAAVHFARLNDARSKLVF